MNDERKAVKYHDRLVAMLAMLVDEDVCHECVNDFGEPGTHAPDCTPAALLREIKNDNPQGGAQDNAQAAVNECYANARLNARDAARRYL